MDKVCDIFLHRGDVFEEGVGVWVGIPSTFSELEVVTQHAGVCCVEVVVDDVSYRLVLSVFDLDIKENGLEYNILYL